MFGYYSYYYPFFSPPHCQHSPPLLRHSGQIRRVKALDCWSFGPLALEKEVVGTGTWIHTELTSTKGTNTSCFVEMVKSKGKIFSLREEMGGGALGDLE